MAEGLIVNLNEGRMHRAYRLGADLKTGGECQVDDMTDWQEYPIDMLPRLLEQGIEKCEHETDWPGTEDTG